MQRHAMLDVREPPVEPLLGRANVLVIFGNVDKILLAEVTGSNLARSQRFGNEGRNARLMALQDFLALELAPVGNNGQIGDPGSLPRLGGHVRQLAAIVADVRDLVRHNQMMHVINGCLNVVANQSCSPTARCH